jgi:hypothetical protein
VFSVFSVVKSSGANQVGMFTAVVIAEMCLVEAALVVIIRRNDDPLSPSQLVEVNILETAP